VYYRQYHLGGGTSGVILLAPSRELNSVFPNPCPILRLVHTHTMAQNESAGGAPPVHSPLVRRPHSLVAQPEQRLQNAHDSTIAMCTCSLAPRSTSGYLQSTLTRKLVVAGPQSSRVSQRIVNSTLNATNKLTHSKRFVKMVDDVFSEVDVDESGTVDAAELFVALLLVNHKLNKLPLGRKLEPPSKGEVQKLFHTVTEGHTINREQFLLICQHQFVTIGEGILLNVFIFLIMVPFLGVTCKNLTQQFLAEGTKAHGFAVKTPDAVFAMIVSTIVTQLRASGALHNSKQLLVMALVVLAPVIMARLKH